MLEKSLCFKYTFAKTTCFLNFLNILKENCGANINHGTFKCKFFFAVFVWSKDNILLGKRMFFIKKFWKNFELICWFQKSIATFLIFLRTYTFGKSKLFKKWREHFFELICWVQSSFFVFLENIVGYTFENILFLPQRNGNFFELICWFHSLILTFFKNLKKFLSSHEKVTFHDVKIAFVPYFSAKIAWIHFCVHFSAGKPQLFLQKARLIVFWKHMVRQC